ncbi:MAG: TonB-dependent receptor [Flavobacteriaceae bacterium]
MLKLKVSLFLLIFPLAFIYGQSNQGRIRGSVYGENQKTMAFANIIIEELQKGIVSDAEGNFEFIGIPFGAYTVTASMVGHNTVSKKITVNNSQVIHIDFVCLENNTQLQEVVVTAEKYENSLQKVPVAMTALGAEMIEQQKVVQIGDLLMSSPNFIAMNAGSPTLNIVASRGILTFSTDPTLGVYIDGVPMFAGYGSSLQLMDIERVEILRGPQSTLYGRNAMGGIVQVITKRPTNHTRGFAEVSVGNYNYQRYGAGISGPLVKNKLYAGFNGLYDAHKGYFFNEFTGEDFDHPKNYNGNFYLKYLASDKLRFTFNAKAEKNDVEGAFPYAVNLESALATPRTVNQNGSNLEVRDLFNTALSVDYNAQKYKLTSITGYTYRQQSYENYDQDFSSFDLIIYESKAQDQKTLTQEFKIVTSQGEKWQFTGGLFGYYDRFRSPNTSRFNDDYALFDPNAPYASTLVSTASLYGFAAYGNLTYNLSDKWKLSAGLRFDTEDRDMVTYSEFEQAPNPIVVSEETKIKDSNNALSSKVNLSFSPNDDLMFYAGYARGFRQGGFNLYTSDPNFFTYDPEYTDNFEFGAKSEWLNHKLRANLALFYIKWKDQQQSINYPNLYVDNIGELTSKGIELELTALPFKGFEVAYNFGYTDAEYQTLILPDADGVEQNYEGNKQVFTPNFNSTLSLTYNQSLGTNVALYVLPQWKLLGKQYFNYYNDLVQDSFSLFNLNLGIKYKDYEISLWGRNLADTKYLSFAYATSTAVQAPVLYGDSPRTIGITLRAKFNSLHN